MVRSFVALSFFILFVFKLNAQNKAIIVYNAWNNDLDNYNPKSFYTKIFELFKNKLEVKQIIGDPTNIDVARTAGEWSKQVQTEVAARKGRADSIFYIAISCQLKLPALNLGKFLFKNPPRASKMTFTYHILDGSGVELAGDTIINRGCLVKTVDENKGARFFYSSFESFNSDMNCHIEVIKNYLEQKRINNNRKEYKLI